MVGALVGGRLGVGRIGALLLIGSVWAASHVSAQQAPAVLRGIVTNQDQGAPVPGARIFLDSVEVAVTSPSGSFWVVGIEPTEYRLSVRAVGFQPFEVIVNLTQPKTYVVEVPLQVGALALEALTVEALRLPRNRVGEIVERMAWGAGDFITRADLDEWGPLETSSALARSSKVKLQFVSMGECLEETLFGKGSEAATPLVPGGQSRGTVNVPGSGSPASCPMVQQRPGMQVLMGRGSRRCIPALYLDGVQYELIAGVLLDDVVMPHDIELIEVYGEFEVPGEFSNADFGCGVIAIWTRTG